MAFNEVLTIISSGATIVDGIDFAEWRPSTGQRGDLFGDIVLYESILPLYRNPLLLYAYPLSRLFRVLQLTKAQPAQHNINCRS